MREREEEARTVTDSDSAKFSHPTAPLQQRLAPCPECDKRHGHSCCNMCVCNAAQTPVHCVCQRCTPCVCVPAKRSCERRVHYASTGNAKRQPVCVYVINGLILFCTLYTNTLTFIVMWETGRQHEAIACLMRETFSKHFQHAV